MTIIGPRLNARFVKINGIACVKGRARKGAECWHSRRVISPGDEVYRPLGNSVNRSTRWLASEIEALEAAERGERCSK